MGPSLETCSIPIDQKTRDKLKELRKGILTEEQYCEPSVRQTQIHGDKEKGTIIHFGQIHAILDEKGESCSGPELEQKTIEYQKQIYETLKKERPDFIMVESLLDGELDLLVGLVHSIFDDALYPYIKKSGKEKRLFDYLYVKSREEAKNRLFYLLGGGLIYGVIHNKPVLPAETKAKNDGGVDALKKMLNIDVFSCSNIYKAINVSKIADLKPSKAIDEVREREALDKIKIVLRGNSGKKVALVYGEGHNFSDQYFKVFGSSGPILERQDFPSISIQADLIPDNKLVLGKGKLVMR